MTDEKTESIEKRQHLVEDPFGGKQFQKEMVTSANDYSDTGSENVKHFELFKIIQPCF